LTGVYLWRTDGYRGPSGSPIQGAQGPVGFRPRPCPHTARTAWALEYTRPSVWPIYGTFQATPLCAAQAGCGAITNQATGRATWGAFVRVMVKDPEPATAASTATLAATAWGVAKIKLAVVTPAKVTVTLVV
jgi:hypothetical protein